MTILHLMEYANVPLSEYLMPLAMTQGGIGQAIGVTRSQVAIIVRRLEEKGDVSWLYAHPKGAKERRKVYYLNPQGIEKGHELRHILKEAETTLDEVIRRPKAWENNSANVLKALDEMDRALRAVQAVRDYNDHERAWEAIESASIAIRFLSKEVA